MKQLPKPSERKNGALVASSDPLPPELAELKALRQAQKETNKRVDDLKNKLFKMTEQHMEQAVNLIRRWLDDKKK